MHKLSAGSNNRAGVKIMEKKKETPLSRELLDLCTLTLKLPMSVHCESLNAAAAAAALLWEMGRVTR